uniref:G_PROTEIN_RECEP_F1_2 domain-containing protein n=1 Tax=Rhabditophanes sp. KR3021 TaxID=114890 RepID=A0AC35TS04_9BILA
MTISNLNNSLTAVVLDVIDEGSTADSFLSSQTSDILPFFNKHDAEMMQNVCIGTLLIVLIVFCVVGNFMVILAILLERELRSRPQYYLIFSLAVADLLVGVIVTPIGAWTTVSKSWNLGVMLCDFWISVDVLLCTASILHLVAIALDRYWSITDIYYVQNRTPRRITWMIAVVWIFSLVVSIAPMLGWKDEKFSSRVLEEHICLISQEISYQVFSTAFAFYIPLIAIIVIYFRIMRAAKKRFKRERDRKTVIRHGDSIHTTVSSRRTSKASKKAEVLKKAKQALPSIPVILNEEKEPLSEGRHDDKQSESNSDEDRFLNRKISCVSNNNEDPTIYTTTTTSLKEARPSFANVKAFMSRKNTLPQTSLDLVENGKCAFSKKAKRKRRSKELNPESKRERKAWRTLAIITGTFLVCWTPFFLVSLYRPICNCKIPEAVEGITSWLGYLNSAINPILYTVFSPDFRMAFQRIIKRLCFFRGFS